MAEADTLAELPAPDKPAGRGAMAKWVGAMLALTLVAAGLGGGLGIKLAGEVEDAVRAKESAEEHPVELAFTMPSHLKPLAPLVTNLAGPTDTWIRIESSIVFDDEGVASDDVLAGEISEDLLAYLRTVSLSQIEGPSGMQHLREDLVERAQIRSENRVRDLVIQTMVLQ